MATYEGIEEAPNQDWEASKAQWGATPVEDKTEQDLAIGRRLTNWKSLLSFLFAAVVLVIAVAKGGINPAETWSKIQHLNLLLFVTAFVVYYCTFPLRGYRWKVLLRNAYVGDAHAEVVEDMSVRGLTEILFISWFVNCVVPAKLGDLYRAYLAKLWAGISWTKTIGTVMAERLVDILVLSVLLFITAMVVFHNRLAHVGIVLFLGFGLALTAILLLVAMKTMSRQVRALIPVRFRPTYIAFEEGTLKSFRRIPLLFGLTAAIWSLEGLRLQLVFLALGVQMHIAGVPYAPMLFLALGTAVLTTIPFTPGGLGLVEAGILSLMIYLNVPKETAAAVVVVDRLLSYWSIAFFGFLTYLLSKRSHFRQPV